MSLQLAVHITEENMYMKYGLNVYPRAAYS